MVEEFSKEKMEGLDVIGGENQTRKETPLGSTESEKGITESRECHDLRRDLADLTSQVQMISDSLVACKQMSKYRPLRKMYDVAVRKKTQRTPQTSNQTLLPIEEATQERPSNAVEKDVIVNYMINKNNESKKLQATYKPEISIKSDLRDLSEHRYNKRSFRGLTLSPNADDFKKPLKRSFKVPKKHKSEEIDTDQMIDLIQRELKVLMCLAPSASLLIVSLSDMVFRYKERAKCSKKLSSSLPWILNRIQELVKYIADKREETYSWTTCDGNHNVESTSGSDKELEKEEKVHKSGVPQEGSPWEIGKLEKVDAAAAIEAIPGVQILLQVKPSKQRKRFFDQAGLRRLGNENVNFPVVQLNEPVQNPLVHVIKPSTNPQQLGDRKKEITFPTKYSFSIGVVLRFPAQSLILLLLSSPVSRIFYFQTLFYLKPIQSFEERILKHSKDFSTEFTKKPESINEPKANISGPCSNGIKTYCINNFLANAPDLVKELLREAQEDRMETQKDIKNLKDLLTEVHKNQIELSHILLKKGIYSQSLIKLTDPNMLEVENQVVKTLEESSFSESTGASLESLMSMVHDLTVKCSLKNKMIRTLTESLLKGNIPNDCWDDIMNGNFDDERPVGEFDSKKVTELIETLSLFFANGEKASRLSLPSLRTEEQPAEEEPNLKENVGANIEEDLKNVSLHDGKIAPSNEFVDCGSPVRILALPPANVSECINASVRKLENQISLLNVENDRLWHEVQELRNLLKRSRNEFNERKMLRSDSSAKLSDSSKTPRKTINLTIQIASEKPSQQSKTNKLLRINEVDEAHSEGGVDGASTSSPVVSRRDSGPNKIGREEFENGKLALLGTRAKFRVKSNRRASQDDLNYLVDSSPNVFKNMKSLAEDSFPNRPVQQITPRPSGHTFQLPKPADSPPPKCALSDVPRAGPSSRKQIEHVPLKPSRMELVEGQSVDLHAAMANERELQPILENDNADFGSPTCSSESIGHTIQQMRTRVRSIHKEIIIMKLKNDRIDKLLDRLVDNSVEDNKSMEKLKNNLKDFSSRLG